ncbi:MAG: hypothetical protein COA78_08790 [Blastopirellula sp.]|nr:MAG: hypothetical protein COA78_08790 [Blastopirellula sp.]
MQFKLPISHTRLQRTGDAKVVIIVVASIFAVMMLACAGVAVIFLIPAVGQARTAARRAHSQGNMTKIGLALHNYHDTFGSFPPAYIPDEDGKPMHSWRVLILPFIEQSNLYEQYNFDEPWDSPNNRAIAQRMPDIYRNPSSDDATMKQNVTTYQAVEGKNAGFDGSTSLKFRNFVDGTSNSVLVIENYDRPVLWTQPSDTSIQAFASGKPFNGSPTGGINALFGDASIHHIDQTTGSQQLKDMAIRNDGKPG